MKRLVYANVRFGEQMPRWMGAAYPDCQRFCVICVLLPFNWPVRWAKLTLDRLRTPSPRWTIEEERDGYKARAERAETENARLSHDNMTLRQQKRWAEERNRELLHELLVHEGAA